MRSDCCIRSSGRLPREPPILAGNGSVARLARATATTGALRRGARLVVVDPRRAGLASRADHWLRVRPGMDCALALAIAHVMIERGWFDDDFVRRWTNAPREAQSR